MALTAFPEPVPSDFHNDYRIMFNTKSWVCYWQHFTLLSAWVIWEAVKGEAHLPETTQNTISQLYQSNTKQHGVSFKSS